MCDKMDNGIFVMSDHPAGVCGRGGGDVREVMAHYWPALGSLTIKVCVAAGSRGALMNRVKDSFEV